MITEDQSDTISFLADPHTHGGAPVEQVETHASVVFLAGSRALKLKRAVRYDYLDFSTAERRRTMCEAEVRVNIRTAPALYHGVAAITRQADGSLALDGEGAPVDWVVVMHRFDQNGLFDRLAAQGRLGQELMSPLASGIARFHRAAASRTDHGGRAGMAWVIDGNATGFAAEGTGTFDPAATAQLTGASRQVLERHGAELDGRRAAGFVRQCHGDLHLRNIVLIDGAPTLFDAIEFNDEIACIDVLYDLGFLLMDLWRRKLPAHANIVWSDYLAETLDLEGVSLLPLFLSCRAAVRAKTSATAATLQSDPERRAELQEMARDYLRMAFELLYPTGPCLIAIGGFSGSGKTTLARALAPAVGPVPGALVVRSDEIRKRLCGVAPDMRLGPAGYTPDVTRRVYATLADRADLVVRRGHSVVVDAVFARPVDRAMVEQVAAAAGVPFAGIWLEAPEQALADRTRRRHGDASDADPAVVHAQIQEGAGPVTWTVIQTSAGPADVLQRAEAAIQEQI